MNKNIQEFLKDIISYHGFSSNTMTGFSCYITNRRFSAKEGLLLWVCKPQEKRIVTKFEHLFDNRRKNRLKQTVISEQEFEEEFTPKVLEYSKILKDQFLFRKIGNGIAGHKIFNISGSFAIFQNNLKLLRDFEIFLVNNPITLFAAEKEGFVIKNKDSLLFDKY